MASSDQITQARPYSARGVAAGADGSQGLALPVILFLMAIVLPVAVQVGPLNMSLLRMLLLLMTPPLLILLLMGRFGKVFLVDYLCIFHVVWMAISLSVTRTTGVIETVGSTGLEFLGGYLLGRAFIRTPAQFITLCKWLGWLVVAMLPIALYEARTGNPIIIQLIDRIPGTLPGRIVTTEGRLGLERVQGTFDGPIHFGMFCSTAFALTYLGLRDIYGNTKRLALSALIALTTFLGLSSGAILALVLQVILMAWFFVFQRVRIRWLLLLGLAVVAYVVVDLFSTRTPMRVFMSYAAFSAHNAFFRAVIFEWGMMNIFGSPENGIPAARVFGIGFADWARPEWMSPTSVDNFWLLMGMRYGVPGALSILVAYGWTIVRLGLRPFDSDQQLARLRRAWIFTFAGIAFTLVTVHVWTSLYSFIFFLFGAGIWMLSVQPPSLSHVDPNTDTDAGPERDRAYSRFPIQSRR